MEPAQAVGFPVYKLTRGEPATPLLIRIVSIRPVIVVANAVVANKQKLNPTNIPLIAYFFIALFLQLKSLKSGVSHSMSYLKNLAVDSGGP